MVKLISKVITYCFYTLFFLVPLILYPHTSEVFEFNKIVLTYILTLIILISWLAKSVIQKKFIFRKSFLDIPILLFLGSQFLSTIFSIDPATSIFGYYTRFSGGLLSLISYAILYWAFVSNVSKKQTEKAIAVSLSSAALVSAYAVLQHFGIDKNIWVQDVQSRVFSTLGQPNWLATWIVAFIPLTWAYIMTKKSKSFWITLSSLFFLVLLYTKSRSGILGFGAGFLIFWGIHYIPELKKKAFGKIVRNKQFITIIALIISLALLVGTPWTPSLGQILGISPQATEPENPEVIVPALEKGGTESGDIRKIVWEGAIGIWKNNFLLGSGVETFAYSYYNHRPVEHNLVSEWDFLYNKAHNEYLNYAANSGTIGLIAYLILIGVTLKYLYKNIEKNKLALAFLSGLVSIHVSNFFGFTVVPTSLQIFLFPAFFISLTSEALKQKKVSNISAAQKVIISIFFLAGALLLIGISRYWYADTLYLKGKLANNAENYSYARSVLAKSIDYSKNQPMYWNEIAQATTGLALEADTEGDLEKTNDYIEKALVEAEKSITLSPKNVNLIRDKASLFLKLSTIDPVYLLGARQTLEELIILAPTDAKLFYNLGLTQVRTGEPELAIQTLEKTVEMKADYRNARFALGLFYADQGRILEAKEQLEYILKYINPDDLLVQQQLAEFN